MENILFSLIIGFCSPVECQEFVIGHSLTEQECTSAAVLAEGLYQPIGNDILYKHYSDVYASELVNGYPSITHREIKCTVDL